MNFLRFGKLENDRKICLFFRSDVGTSGALETMFYCEVMNEDKVSNGGGVDGNFI